MNPITVETKEELKRAYDNKYNEILVVGDLAKQLGKINIGKAGIAILLTVGAAAVVAAPITGGKSIQALKSVAEKAGKYTGAEIALMIMATSIGITLILAVCKDYEIETSGNAEEYLKGKAGKGSVNLGTYKQGFALKLTRKK